jgi:hypothetical protein
MENLTTEERHLIAKDRLNQLTGFSDLSEKTQNYMIQSYSLGMIEMSILDREVKCLGLKLKINELKS